MYKEALNNVRIIGILSENNLKYNSYEKNGATVEAIGGNIKVQVPQEINGESIINEIPVHMFSPKYTKKGDINPSYQSIEKVMKEFNSIAATGSVDTADKIIITGAKIKMNEFYGQDGRLVSQPRINASFVSKVVGEFNPTATFSLEFMVSGISRVMDKDGVELDPVKLEVQTVVPQYTAETADALNVDLVPLYAVSADAVSGIEGNWSEGNCYRINGRLNFTSKTEEIYQEVDFGEPQKRTRTTSISELIITGGSLSPLDEEYAWSIDDIKKGVAARKVRLENAKNSTPKSTPAQNTKGKVDLGF